MTEKNLDIILPLAGDGTLVVAAKECGDAALASALAVRLTQMGMRVWVRGAESEGGREAGREGKGGPSEDVDTELA